MGIEDLYTAMNMFKQGVNEYATGQAISAASDEVNKLNTMNMDELKKRNELTKVGNSLALHLGAFGTPVSQIQSAVGAIAPAPFKDAQDMYMAGVQAGPKGASLKAGSLDVQKFEEAPKLNAIDRTGMWHERAAAATGERAASAADRKQQNITNKEFAAFDKSINPMAMRGGNLAVAQKTVMSAERLDGLFQQFPDGSMPKTSTHEIAAAVAALVTGGSPQSQQQINDLTPQSMVGKANEIASWVTNTPRGLEQQKFMKMLHETALREKDIAHGQVKRGQLESLAGFSHLEQADPERYNKLLKLRGITPEMRQAFDRGTYNPLDPSTAPKAAAGFKNGVPMAGTGPHGPIVKQGGKTYRWNPATNQYQE